MLSTSCRHVDLMLNPRCHQDVKYTLQSDIELDTEAERAHERTLQVIYDDFYKEMIRYEALPEEEQSQLKKMLMDVACKRGNRPTG